MRSGRREVEPVTAESLWDLTKTTFARWNEIDASSKGAALAFYTLLSAAPMLVLSIGVAALVFGRQAAEGQVVWQIRHLVGSQAAEIIQTVLAHASKPSAGIFATATGFVMLLLGASGVFIELRESLNRVWRVRSAGAGISGMLRERFFSFAVVLGVGFLLLILLLVSALVAAAEKFIGGFLPLPAPSLDLATVVVSFLTVTVLFALLYKVVPDVRIEWEDVWIGAAVTAVLFSMGKFLIGLYLGRVSVGSPYGAAGSLVVFLVWIYYSAMIFFLGAAFTRAFAERHGSRARRHVQRLNSAAQVRPPRRA